MLVDDQYCSKYKVMNHYSYYVSKPSEGGVIHYDCLDYINFKLTKNTSTHFLIQSSVYVFKHNK